MPSYYVQRAFFMLREEALTRIRKAYGYDYDLDKEEMEGRAVTDLPIVMTAAFHSNNAKYVLSKKAVLWEAGCHEYMYVFDVPHLTQELVKQGTTYAYEEGMKLIHPQSGHMCSYISVLFLCDSCDKAAKKELGKCRHYKSFHFSLYGWMDFHAAAVVMDEEHTITNRSGRCMEKIMKNILFKRKRK